MKLLLVSLVLSATWGSNVLARPTGPCPLGYQFQALTCNNSPLLTQIGTNGTTQGIIGVFNGAISGYFTTPGPLGMLCYYADSTYTLTSVLPVANWSCNVNPANPVSMNCCAPITPPSS